MSHKQRRKEKEGDAFFLVLFCAIYSAAAAHQLTLPGRLLLCGNIESKSEVFAWVSNYLTQISCVQSRSHFAAANGVGGSIDVEIKF